MANRYKDISLNFAPHPGTGDVSVVTDDVSVRQSIKNILLTNYDERFFDLEFGGNVTAFLFENWTPLVAAQMEERVKSTINAYEKRANVLKCTVYPNPNQNGLDVDVIYRTNLSDQDAKLNIALKRVF